jgi:hypothetical protein
VISIVTKLGGDGEEYVGETTVSEWKYRCFPLQLALVGCALFGAECPPGGSEHPCREEGLSSH